MEEKNIPFERIVFVCVNERGKHDRICCAAGRGAEIYGKLKQAIKDIGLKGKVRVSKSGCMDVCEQGPNVMLFPDNVWFYDVDESDIPYIAARIAQGLSPKVKGKSK